MNKDIEDIGPGGEVLAPSASSFVTTTPSRITAQQTIAALNPRNETRNLEKARVLALREPEEAHYSLPRGGKNIEGPSVRLAETIAATWGNLRAGTKITNIGEREITVVGVAHDTENNVEISIEIQRRITDRNGRRFSDDLINLTAMAASSIAYRNVVFRIIPHPLWAPIYQACLEAMNSGKVPLAERRTKALAWFRARGIEEATILAKLGKKNLGEIGAEDLQTLTGIRNAIREETSTVEEIFGTTSGPAVKHSLDLHGKDKPADDPFANPAEPGSAG